MRFTTILLTASILALGSSIKLRQHQEEGEHHPDFVGNFSGHFTHPPHDEHHDAPVAGTLAQPTLEQRQGNET